MCFCIWAWVLTSFKLDEQISRERDLCASHWSGNTNLGSSWVQMPQATGRKQKTPNKSKTTSHKHLELVKKPLHAKKKCTENTLHTGLWSTETGTVQYWFQQLNPPPYVRPNPVLNTGVQSSAFVFSDKLWIRSSVSSHVAQNSLGKEQVLGASLLHYLLFLCPPTMHDFWRSTQCISIQFSSNPLCPQVQIL